MPAASTSPSRAQAAQIMSNPAPALGSIGKGVGVGQGVGVDCAAELGGWDCGEEDRGVLVGGRLVWVGVLVGVAVGVGVEVAVAVGVAVGVGEYSGVQVGVSGNGGGGWPGADSVGVKVGVSGKGCTRKASPAQTGRTPRAMIAARIIPSARSVVASSFRFMAPLPGTLTNWLTDRIVSKPAKAGNFYQFRITTGR
jgi:hypothetical protein